MRPEYVHLDRRFESVSPTRSAEEAAFASYVPSHEAGKGWGDVLADRNVVVLGEAGSGKSWEFEAQVERLRGAGNRAFFVRLDVLVHQPLRRAVDTADLPIFDEWLRGTESASFFLDSVDEARLTGRAAFHAALNNFAQDLLQALPRARVVVSCRVSEWHWELDQLELRKLLRLLPGPRVERDGSVRKEKKATDPQISVYAILPLDRSRVSILAEKYGVKDVAEFANAIDQADVWDYVGRPGDVSDFAQYWISEGRLGSLTEILGFTIGKRLRETPEREDKLPPQDLRDAVQTLAAGAILCKSYTFRTVDDPGQRGVAGAALDTKAVLPDWSPAQIRDLQQRGIFDGAHFGKIRFHHRNVVEYLAAKWIEGLKNAPVRKILGLLFSTSHGRKVLIPSRAPIAAWIASGDSQAGVRVRERLLKANPQILLTKGDPQQLPIEFRRSMLQALLSRFDGRLRASVEADPAQLRRLATPGLADTISQLINQNRFAVDLRELLLNIAAEGKLQGCVPAALDILRHLPGKHSGLHFSALALIGRAGQDRQLQEAWQLVSQYDSPTDALCQLAIRDLYPIAMQIQDVVRLLEKSPEVPTEGVRHLEYGLVGFVKDGKFDRDLEGLLMGLTELLQRPPYISVDGRIYPVSGRYLWLDGTVMAICVRLLSRQSLELSLAERLGESASVLGACKRADHYHGQKFDLHTHTEAHPLVRRSYVVNRYLSIRRLEPDKLSRLQPLSNLDGILRPSGADLAWLCAELSRKDDKVLRSWLLDVALSEWQWLRYPTGWLSKMRRAVFDDPKLAGRIPNGFAVRLKQRLGRAIGFVRYQLTWKLQATWRRITDSFAERRLWMRMWVQANKLQSAEYDGWLRLLIHDREVRGSSSELSDVPHERLVQAYGKRIGDAAWEGVKRYWRIKEVPSKTDNQIPVSAVLGLAGLAADSEDGLRFDAIDATLARKAAILATHELNGFPRWFISLAEAHLVTVSTVLDPHIAREWAIPEDKESVHEVLAKLRYDTTGVDRLFAVKVRDQLMAKEPPHPTILSHAIGIVLKNPTTRHDIARLVPLRIGAYGPDQRQFTTWLTVWLALDATPALDYLDRMLASLPLERADSIVVGISAGLSERRGSDLPDLEELSYLRLPSIVKLVSLVCRHVRSADDIDRSNKGVYSPTPRDHAQSFRGTLFRLLSELTQPGAYAALQALAVDPAMAAHREWLLHLMDAKAETEVDPPAWDPVDIAIFATKYETRPRATSELNQMILWRLEDLRDTVENADFVSRNVIEPRTADEYALQLFVARELDRDSRDHYSIEREPEVFGRKEPDIRVKVPGLDPIAIEVKWADDWDLKQLVAALTDQLVGRYLRAASSRYGVLLLASRGGRKAWEGHTFEALVDYLRGVVSTILNENENVDGLEVFPIEFAKR